MTESEDDDKLKDICYVFINGKLSNMLEKLKQYNLVYGESWPVIA